jgi:hypothetical protein
MIIRETLVTYNGKEMKLVTYREDDNVELLEKDHAENVKNPKKSFQHTLEMYTEIFNDKTDCYNAESKQRAKEWLEKYYPEKLNL